jgi:hypothetical protein
MSSKDTSPTSADGFIKRSIFSGFMQSLFFLQISLKVTSSTRSDQLTARLRDKMMQKSFSSRPGTRTKVQILPNPGLHRFITKSDYNTTIKHLKKASSVLPQKTANRITELFSARPYDKWSRKS